MPHFSNEAQAWELLHGPDSQSLRDECDRIFEKLFPAEGGGIRKFLDLWKQIPLEKRVASSKGQALLDIHPLALELLLEHGTEYAPFIWPEKPPEEPEKGGCFKNARSFMFAHNKAGLDILYVEGVVIGATVMPMLHAWNAASTKATTAIDWTHSAGSRWSRYFGIAITEKEYDEVARLIYPEKERPVISLLHNRDFPKLQEFLTELLKRRKQPSA